MRRFYTKHCFAEKWVIEETTNFATKGWKLFVFIKQLLNPIKQYAKLLSHILTSDCPVPMWSFWLFCFCQKQVIKDHKIFFVAPGKLKFRNSVEYTEWHIYYTRILGRYAALIPGPMAAWLTSPICVPLYHIKSFFRFPLIPPQSLFVGFFCLLPLLSSPYSFPFSFFSWLEGCQQFLHSHVFLLVWASSKFVGFVSNICVSNDEFGISL